MVVTDLIAVTLVIYNAKIELWLIIILLQTKKLTCRMIWLTACIACTWPL